MTEATITEKKAKNPPVREGSIWRYLGTTLKGIKVNGSLIFEVRFAENQTETCQLWQMRRSFSIKKEKTTLWRPFNSYYRIDNFTRTSRWEHLQG